MRLNFGPIEFDAKGLPRIYSLRVSPGILGEGPLTVSILLESDERAAVAKWAKRLGVQVVDCEPYRARPEYPWTRTFEAVHEAEGYRVRVWTSMELDDSLPWHVYAQSQDGARQLVNAFAARELAERFAQRHPDQYGPLTVEDARPVHWAIDGRAACRTGSLSDPMTRLASGATCAACRALIPKEGAS